jgi:nitrate reductase beta subunit
VHRLPHLLGHLQAGVDEPQRRRVRLVQQRRDAPGQGYPRTYQDQERWKGGWQLTSAGCRCEPAVGSRSCFQLFSNPLMPSIDDYYEPWTYDYETLTDAPAQKHTPVARPKSLISGKEHEDPVVRELGRQPRRQSRADGRRPRPQAARDKVKLEFEQTFMFYLPRICEHCLNPSCAASCPSGAIYKREEDGIVLVDQDKCRGWRMCVTGCPYKKIYFNHRTGKAEKCTFCFPRVEVGIPTVCSETCVGRLRYIGDRALRRRPRPRGRVVEDEHELLAAQRSVLLDPDDPAVQRAAEAAASPATG